jgi:adenosylcobinamide-GDP ribazoletransferase
MVVMQNVWTGIKLGLGYFTVAPIRIGVGEEGSAPLSLRAMVWSLPLAGWLLGLVVLGLAMLLAKMGAYGCAVAAVIYPMLYGYLHAEAVMDVGDALHAAHGGKDPYAVIKDPTVGAMGALWGIGLLVLKTILIAYLLGMPYAHYWLVVPTVSRLGLVVLIALMSFRSQFVEQLHRAVARRDAVVLTAIVGGVLWAMTGWQAVVLLFLGVVVARTIAIRLRTILGFANGDVLGAVLEGVEIVLLAAIIGWGEMHGIS